MKYNFVLISILLSCNLCFCQWNQVGSSLVGDNQGDQAGYTSDINIAGNIIVFGSYADLPSSSAAAHGQVKVFEYDQGTWTQIGSDIYGEHDQDFSVYTKLNAAGNILAIGGYGNDDNGDFSGHVRVFENTGGTWNQLGGSINGAQPGDFAGQGISLNDSGNIIAIASPHNSNNAADSGHVRVFEYIGNSWVQIGSSISGDTPQELMGLQNLVSLNASGNILAVGTRWRNNETDSGTVKIYENQGGNWNQIGSDITNDDLSILTVNHALAINAAGDRIVIGSSYGNGMDPSIGRARVFENQGGTWSQVGLDIYGEGVGDFAGYSVSINALGDVIAVGSPYNDKNGTNSGQVRVFKYIDDAWTKINGDLTGKSEYDEFGYSVSLNAAGDSVVVGAPTYNVYNTTSLGEISVFNYTNILSTEDYTSETITLYPNPANDHFIMELGKIHSLIAVEIYNSLGQKVNTYSHKNSNELRIDCGTWTSGIYYVHVQTPQMTQVKKLILQN